MVEVVRAYLGETCPGLGLAGRRFEAGSVGWGEQSENEGAGGRRGGCEGGCARCGRHGGRVVWAVSGDQGWGGKRDGERVSTGGEDVFRELDGRRVSVRLLSPSAFPPD